VHEPDAAGQVRNEKGFKFMLIFTRKVGEQFVIGEDVVVTILAISPDRCKVGIDAPTHIRVDRSEIRVKIDEARRRGDGRDGR
jgi:carbon storage regulator